MNKVEKLIQELCPEQVEHRELFEIEKFYGELTDKIKHIFKMVIQSSYFIKMFYSALFFAN